jgi:spore maturation protein CgeB
VAHYFKKGVHLEWSVSPEETLALADYYLKHDGQREKIALEGQREVNEKHRLVHRARAVLDIMARHI